MYQSATRPRALPAAAPPSEVADGLRIHRTSREAAAADHGDLVVVEGIGGGLEESDQEGAGDEGAFAANQPAARAFLAVFADGERLERLLQDRAVIEDAGHGLAAHVRPLR